tara:strand:+ start:727 stop:909 length:183 start_codon:yes stop_codon:yes gene_type:complete
MEDNMNYNRKIRISLTAMQLKVLYKYLKDNVMKSDIEKSSIHDIINILEYSEDNYNITLD